MQGTLFVPILDWWQISDKELITITRGKTTYWLNHFVKLFRKYSILGNTWMHFWMSYILSSAFTTNPIGGEKNSSYHQISIISFVVTRRDCEWHRRHEIAIHQNISVWNEGYSVADRAIIIASASRLWLCLVRKPNTSLNLWLSTISCGCNNSPMRFTEELQNGSRYSVTIRVRWSWQPAMHSVHAQSRANGRRPKQYPLKKSQCADMQAEFWTLNHDLSNEPFYFYRPAAK